LVQGEFTTHRRLREPTITLEQFDSAVLAVAAISFQGRGHGFESHPGY
jgi:hypothetical protein